MSPYVGVLLLRLSKKILHSFHHSTLSGAAAPAPYHWVPLRLLCLYLLCVCWLYIGTVALISSVCCWSSACALLLFHIVMIVRVGAIAGMGSAGGAQTFLAFRLLVVSATSMRAWFSKLSVLHSLHSYLFGRSCSR